jgi:hypothetical protein
MLLLPDKVHGKPKEWLLENVLYLPNASANLFSVKQVSGSGGSVTFTDNKCFVYKNQTLLYESRQNPFMDYITAETLPGPYTLNDVFPMPTSMQYVGDRAQAALTARVSALMGATAEVWHARLGHLGLDNMALMINKEMVDGFPLTKVDLDATKKDPSRFCEPCAWRGEVGMGLVRAGGVRRKCSS